jgi:chromosome condensin MukBEF MukE localization factor
LSRKARETAKQATPAGLAGNLGEAISELAGAIGSFGADVRAGMEEREEELSEVVEQRSGVSPMTRRALGGRDEAQRRAIRPSDARARRAGS